MSIRVVIDSNVLVALVDNRDKWHLITKKIYSALEAKDAGVVYFDCVINEVISVLGRRSEEQRRSEDFPILLNELQKQVPADKITWISPAIKRIYHDTIELVRDTSGALNFHDSMMALACRELGIKFIVTFDQDFDNIEWLKRISHPDEIKSVLQVSPNNL